MALEKTIKLSEQAHERLARYRDKNGHTSFDSAVRELVPDE
jgi:predicted CopG family antitoxin